MRIAVLENFWEKGIVFYELSEDPEPTFECMFGPKTALAMHRRVKKFVFSALSHPVVRVYYNE
jgi:hypothetical protein